MPDFRFVARFVTNGIPFANHLWHQLRQRQISPYRHRVLNDKMSGPDVSPPLGAAVFLAASILIGMYFTFSAVQGDYGVFQRIQINAEAEVLADELDVLRSKVAALENKTRRLSDQYLDLDLLDQQARDILGLVRPDEIVFE